MSYHKVWIHVVWGTKNRYPFLTRDFREIIFSHILDNAEKKNIRIEEINGYFDHVHCILKLEPSMCFSKAMQLIKGESSSWINKQKLTENYFNWADDYYAVSVSEFALDRIQKYVQNQEAHHRENNLWHKYEEEFGNFRP